MADTTSMNLRIDKDLKKEAEALFDKLGINMTTAINIFLRQSVRDQAIPFKISASKDYNRIPAYRDRANGYANYDEYVVSSLREADMKVAEGKMEYYTADEIKSKLEEVLGEKI